MPPSLAAIVLAAETGEGGGIGLVLPEPAELIWGLVGFALLMVYMFWRVFPRLNQLLEDRRDRIQGQLEEAESVRNEAEELKRQYEEQLADARSEASQIVSQAREDGQRQRDEIVSRAEEEANQITSRAREDAESERGRVVQSLRGQVARLSVELASKIVQTELNEDRHRDLVDSYIDRLSGMDGQQASGDGRGQ